MITWTTTHGDTVEVASAIAPWTSREWAVPLADAAYREAVWSRLLANVNISPAGCWEWQRFRNPDGYGVISIKRRMKTAHMVALAIHRDSLWPKEFQVDHLCQNRACCNPDHLEVVTPGVNARRSSSPALTSQRIRARTHCPQGHEYDAANTRLRAKGYRSCRACDRANDLRPVECPDCGRVMARSNLRRHRRSCWCGCEKREHRS